MERAWLPWAVPKQPDKSMSETAVQTATYEDLLRVHEHLVAEIVNGRLESHPRPAPRHALAASSLEIELGAPFHKGRDGPGGWWILMEPELHLGPHVLVPDLCGWRREKMPGLPETAWFDTEPDWICEILSPATARLDRADKMPIYAEQDVRHLWLIDVDIRTLEAYELRDGNWVLLNTFDDEKRVRAAPFDAIEFPLGVLWAS